MPALSTDDTGHRSTLGESGRLAGLIVTGVAVFFVLMMSGLVLGCLWDIFGLLLWFVFMVLAFVIAAIHPMAHDEMQRSRVSPSPACQRKIDSLGERVQMIRRLIPNRPWVLYRNGTIVLLDGEMYPEEQAGALLGGLAVNTHDDASVTLHAYRLKRVPCWLVGGRHPNVLTLVDTIEAGSFRKNAFVACQLGRSKGREDMFSRQIMYIESAWRYGYISPLR